ncbi:MAG: DUF502 domain-containing protein [Candidatus Aminicenantes bacterium]|nr:DUF502 domain-containing protein [Candidatus Aminicenantes bacterium]
MKTLRRFFVTGLIVIIPLWVTILLIRAVVNMVENTMSFIPASFHPRTYIPFYGIELIIALILIVLIGVVANNYFGKKLFNKSELILAKIPVIKTIYQGVKHLTIGIFSDKKIFSRVVLLEFPIKGLFFIGFVTGEDSKELPHLGERRMLKVFVPTTPNPTSGFFCFVPLEEVTDLNISVDEAFKMIISAGYSNLNSA